jgi:hypothetical protein
MVDLYYKKSFDKEQDIFLKRQKEERREIGVMEYWRVHPQFLISNINPLIFFIGQTPTCLLPIFLHYF